VQTTSRKFQKSRKGPITKDADKKGPVTKDADKKGPIRHLKQGALTGAQKEHLKKNTIQL